jgi:hypothetical protein
MTDNGESRQEHETAPTKKPWRTPHLIRSENEDGDVEDVFDMADIAGS